MKRGDRPGNSPRSGAFRQWFTQPPRPHGEIDRERSVTPLELLYDLVFVVLISRLAQALSSNTSWVGARDFGLAFGLVWIAWINGSAYQELHGREDGRSRLYIFGQMFVLVVLAVFAGDVTGADGRWFSIAYAVLVLHLTVQWYLVRRIDDEAFMAITGRYLYALAASAVIVAGSGMVDGAARLAGWSSILVIWVVGGLTRFGLPATSEATELQVTHSMVERFGALVIIVLGEIVVGVVSGITAGGRTGEVFATGLLALGVCFGCWWNYFDLVGQRLPHTDRPRTMAWVYGHLPLTAAIAAGGAGMVSLVDHAGQGRTPVAAAALLGLSVSAVLASLCVLIWSIDYGDDAPLVLPVTAAVAAGAGVALAAMALRPTPWLFALLLAVDLYAVWAIAFALRVRRVTAR